MGSVSLWLYRVLGHCALLLVIPVIWVRDRLTGKARPPFADRLRWDSDGVPEGALWIQAVSVGEVEVARRLIAELESAAPDLDVLVTSTTATGLALARSALSDRAVVKPCPLDLPHTLSRLFEEAAPRALVLVETELWPEMMHQAGRRGAPVAVVNARLSESSFRGYRRLLWFLRPLLAPVSLVAARSVDDGERFAALGIDESRIEITGNIKYDLEPGIEPLSWAQRVQDAASSRPVVVAGSTMDGEEEMVLDAVARLAEGGTEVLLVLAPRHPERFDSVAELVRERGLTCRRRSADCEDNGEIDVFLLDTIGELGRAYGLSFAAFIGGSLVPTGGHNPLEPAVWGVPTLTGPNVFNFSEVYAEMTAAGGAVVVQDAPSLAAALKRWIDHPEQARAAGRAGRAVVDTNRGATARTVAALLKGMGRRDHETRGGDGLD